MPVVQNDRFALLLYLITTRKPLETDMEPVSERHIQHIKQNNSNTMARGQGEGEGPVQAGALALLQQSRVTVA